MEATLMNRLPESFVTQTPSRTTVRDQALSEWDRDLRKWYGKVETLVSENPGLCLAVAFFVGASVAWWIKRR
jgi:hypothetical protein